jgi:hypothetical protein
LLGSLRHKAVEFEAFAVDDGSEPPLAVPADFAVSRSSAPFVLQSEHSQGVLNAGRQHIVAAGFSHVARLDAGDLRLLSRFAAMRACNSD